MKDSAIDWIGEIPNDWENTRLKYAVDNNKYYQIGDGDHGSISPDDYKDDGIPYIRVQNFTFKGEFIKDGLVFISEEIHKKNKKSRLLPDDLLISKTGATVGKVILLDESYSEYNTTSSVGKITFDKSRYYPKFMFYTFQSDFIQEIIKLYSYQKSAQPGFNIDQLINFTILKLDITEQKKIADYLDDKTEKIDSLIENIKKKIELLEEQRSALISNVVTGKIRVS